MSIAIVGGGIIGLAIAEELDRRGAGCTVYDAAGPGDEGAWHVSGGMIAAGRESAFEHPQLARLLATSARMWPEFADNLGADVGYDRAGSLGLALTADDVAIAQRVWRVQDVPVLRGERLRALEPALSPRVRIGVHAPDECQVDPRRVMAVLRERLAGRIVSKRIGTLDEVDADTVVVAAGCGTAALTGLPVRPVKGQVLRLRGEPGLLRHVITGFADGRFVYLVPRASGEVVVGATQEERGDFAVTAGGVHELLRAALDLVPGLSEFELAEVAAGHRPGTPDNAPLLGRLDDRVVVASGHHRSGVLLAPVTARLIADLVLTGSADPMLDDFAPGRFGCAS
ncbi:glycine oxidase ThiO [Actinoplanes teichomyceticus]|uniref:glycine oxidase n=1 Tax=Actinoplanes teichomyceticus TaxID=1867 RepID=A0A561VQK1_ACTTI|nr:glycine oxidase ThiO [Actinoplanes teichomyceticus]TWG13871.1 glycine oxidase [Actinoplanes teichomyceticus]GIF12305.1 putative thiamine biosynthesis oxidoreductase ThiO [Actinoplanes teichomyceticus]